MSDNAWIVREEGVHEETNRNSETLFTLANGYIGMRGDVEEDFPGKSSKRGTFVNGFYEMSAIPYGEVAYGYAKNTQTMLNVCNAKKIVLSIGGEPVSVLKEGASQVVRELDMEHGIQTRSFCYTTKAGNRFRILTERLVSMARKNIALITCSIEALDGEEEIKAVSFLDGSLITGEESDDPRIAGSLGDGDFRVGRTGVKEEKAHTIMEVLQETKRSGQKVLCLAAENNSQGVKAEYQTTDQTAYAVYETVLKKGESWKLDKYICYVTNQREHSRDFEEYGISELIKAYEKGAAGLKEEQEAYFKDAWQGIDIRILEDERLTRSMRFNMFHLLQSTGKDSYTSIAAKGLSGEGYGGHYFWESEAYIMPVFLYTRPEIAKSLLEYRYHILDKAREQARLLGHEHGALYSWRSIDGEECSAFFLGGSSQYHINADIAFGIAQYVRATRDDKFLFECGVEILLETARLWIDAGHYSPEKQGRFCIDCVTGPDEYTAMVNNNFYTNVMARENLWNAVKFAGYYKEKDLKGYQHLCEKIGFQEEELEGFQKAADQMYIPYSEERKIHMQDDTFLSKKVLDLTAIPEENHPLLTHYHPLFIYRHQVCKQADLILAEFYLPQYFDAEDKKRDYDYYEKVTTHDSSLSASVFSIMAADNGNKEKAYQYFIQTVRTDLDDNQRNTKDGLHMANMAGAWACIVYGFGGMKILDGELTLKPIVPDQWKGYEFSVLYLGRRIGVKVTKEETVYELLSPGTFEIRHYGETLHLVSGEKTIIHAKER